MNRIFKYDFGRLIPGIHAVTLDNKVNYIMDFQEQHGNIVMWASVNEKFEPKLVSIDVRWTGEPPSDWQYVKTIQGSDGLVYHIFLEPTIGPVC